MADLSRYRQQIEAALQHAGDTHRLEDIQKMVDDGYAQAWTGERSIAVTQIVQYPTKKVLHFFVVGGDLAELQARYPEVEAYAKREGCSGMSLLGRPGWERTFLARTGWKRTAVLMETEWQK